MSSFRLAGRALVVLAAALTGAVAPASAAVTSRQAADRAVASLGVKASDAPVIVFRSGAALGAGTVVSQAGASAPPAGVPSGLGVVTSRTKPILRVPAGRRAYLFYADLAPYQAYAHRGRIALVDIATGSVRLSKTLTSPPVIGGRLPFYMRSGEAYGDPANHVFSTPYKVTTAAAAGLRKQRTFGYRVDRAPLADLALARRAADGLASDRACVLRVSDTFGEFYDFTGADNTRARLGDLFYVLAKLNPGFIDQRYSRSSGDSPTEAMERLITEKGCKDVLLYVAGRGYSKGPGTTLGVGTRVEGGRVRQQLLQASAVEAAVRKHPGVVFSLKIDAPHSKPFVDRLALLPNVAIAESAAGTSGASFGYLPEVYVDGKPVKNLANPDGLLEFTNRSLRGIERFLTSASEVDAALRARAQNTVPSLLAVMLGRAFTLGETDDLPALTGIQRPFFAPTKANPTPPAAPTPAPPVAAKGDGGQPLASPGSATTAEDTPVAITLGGVDPNGQTPEFAIESGPAHGTLSGAGAARTYTPAADFTGTDSFVFSVRRGGGNSLGNASTATFTITVSPVDDAPVVVTSAGQPAFTEGGAPVVVDAGVTVTDIDTATVTGATVAITAGVTPDDELLFTNASGITGAYSAASGTLTLTGAATLAEYQAALRSIRFRITGANPAGGDRRIAVRVTTGGVQSAPATRTVAVTVVDDAPVLSGLPGTVAYTEDAPATAVGTGAAVADPDSPTLTSATVAVTVGYDGTQDRLEFGGAPGITGSFDATTGVLSLAGTASRADYEAALASVGYRNLSDDPSTATRTLSFRVDDGTTASNVATTDVTVAAVNDAPVVSSSSAPGAYTEQAPPVPVDPALTVVDPDDGSLEGATVQITAGVQAADVLGFTNTVAITGSFDAATHTLTLTGTATKAAYEAALRSVTFSTPGDDPVTAARAITFWVDDGALQSAGASRDVAVTPVNDAPVVAIASGSVTFTENGAPVAIDPAAAVSDPDDANLASATVTISAGRQSGDELVFTDGNGITGVFTAATGVLALSGSASTADYATALRDVRFRTTSDDPATAPRTVTFTVDDGDATSAADARDVAVAAVNDAASVITSAGTTAYTEGGAPIAVDAALTVADPDDVDLTGATVTLGAGKQAGDALAFSDTPTIIGSFDPATGVLTLTGADTLNNYRAALRAVTYASTDTSVPNGTRTIGFRVDDGDGLGATSTKTVSFGAVNSAPFVGSSPGATTYSEASAPVAIDPALTLIDSDDTNLKSAEVRIAAGLTAGDTLGFTDGGGITHAYDAATGTLTLTGSATVPTYRAALRSVTFSSSSLALVNGTRTITFAATDPADATSPTDAKTVSVTAVNNAPVVTPSGSTPSYTENGPAQVVDGGLAIADPDSSTLGSASVTVTNAVAGDALATTVPPAFGLTVGGTPTALTITGTGTLAEYQALLRSVTFVSTSENPTATSRTVRFAVTDSGGVASANADKTLTVVPVNDAPVGLVDGFTTNEDTVSVTNALANDTDAEGDTLTAERINGVPANVGTPVTLSSGATVTLASDGQLTFNPMGAYDGLQVGDPNATETITYRAKDPSGDTTADTTVTFTITPVNDAPSAPSRAFNAVANADLELEQAGTGGSTNPKVRIDGHLLTGASDPDDAVNTIAITDETVASAGGGQSNIDADGTFVYVSDNGAAENGTDTFTFEVTDPHGGSRDVTVTVNLRERIWFVDPTPPGAGNEGTTANPFTTVAGAAAAAAANDPIYVAAGTASGSATLGSGQTLLGEGVALTADLGGSGTPSGVTQLKAAGTRPTLTGSGAAVVTLGSANTVRGLNVNPDTTADGIAGATASTTTITDVDIADTGTATSGDGIDISNGTVNLTNVDVTTNGTGAGLRLLNTTANAGGGSDVVATGGPAIVAVSTTGGTLALGTASSTNSSGSGITLGGGATLTTTATTIVNPSGIGLALSGNGSFSASDAATSKIEGSGSIGLQAGPGTGSITFPGPITPDTNARAVDIQNRSGSSAITLSGTITTTGNDTGIQAAGNSGGSVALTGTKSITATGDTGILLTANTGSTVTFSGGALTVGVTSGTGIAATGGGTATIGGSTVGVTTTGGPAISTNGTTTSFPSTTTLNATNGAGVQATNATTSFTSGALAITTNTGAGLQASGGGTLTVTGGTNTIAATKGTALSVDSTAIGAGDLTFRSINATGTAVAPNGVVLKSTGSSGELHVTGDAGTTRNASGGVISNVVGADSTSATAGNGIYVSDSDGAVLEQMTVSGSDNHGVRVAGSNGFTFRHGTVTDNGDNGAGPFYEGNVRLEGMTGTATIDDNVLSAPQNDNVHVLHDSGTGTYAITGNAISMDLARAAIQNDNVLVEGGVSGSLTANVSGNTFTEVGGDHVQVAMDDGSANWDVDVKNNTMSSTSDPEKILGGVTIATANNTGGGLLYDVDNNTMSGTRQGSAVRVFHGSTQSGAGATLQGYIRNNDIGVAGTNQSGASESSGISLADVSAKVHTVLIENNVVRQWAQNGIVADVGSSAAFSTLNATIRGNTVEPFATGTGVTPVAGIHLNVGVGAGQTGTSCLDIGGTGAQRNTVNAGGAAGGDIRIRQRNATTVQLPGFGGPADSTGLHNYLVARNLFTDTVTNGSTTTGSISNTAGGAPCPLPTH